MKPDLVSGGQGRKKAETLGRCMRGARSVRPCVHQPACWRARSFARAGACARLQNDLERYRIMQKMEQLRKELQQEQMTQKQLEEKIAELRRKNAKSNKKLAELNDCQYGDDPQYVDEDQEDRKTNKRRKRSIKAQRPWDAPSVMFYRRVW